MGLRLTANERAHVAIIGGGPAGLSAALVLARARRRVVVLDSGRPRNARSPAVGGLLSRDGTPPHALRTMARDEIERYGNVRFLPLQASAISTLPDGDGFQIEADEGPSLSSDRVLLALGMEDVLPAIDGLPALWGRSVIHCPFCHGWENAQRRWAVLASSVQHLTLARTCLCWTDDVVVVATPELAIPARIHGELTEAGIPIHRGVIARLLTSPEGELQAVCLAGGEHVECGTLIVRPAQRQTAFVRSLQLTLDHDERVQVDPLFRTSRPGIFAAGDLCPGPQSVAAAIAAGSTAAMHIVGSAGGA